MNLPIMTLIKAGTGRIRENKEPGRRTCVSARFVFAAAVLLASLPVAADLQTVQVGGEIRIRGQYWRNSFDNPTATTYTGNMIRWPASALGGRPIGDPYGGQTIVSFFDWDDARDDYRLVEQRTRLNIRADFSDSATAYTELESYEAWGEDFRSNYITAVDRRGNSDVEVYQAYIEVRDLFGSPLQLRLGRQEITLGSGWLVGNNNNLPEFGGLSFDAARLTWATDQFSADALWAKLAEQFNSWNDGDRDLFALYGSYTGLEAVAFDLYWILLRDSAYLEDTDATWLGEQIEAWMTMRRRTCTPLAAGSTGRAAVLTTISRARISSATPRAWARSSGLSVMAMRTRTSARGQATWNWGTPLTTGCSRACGWARPILGEKTSATSPSGNG